MVPGKVRRVVKMCLILTKLSKIERLIIVTTLVIWVFATVVVAGLVSYTYQSNPKNLAQAATPTLTATLTPTKVPPPTVTLASTPTGTPAPTPTPPNLSASIRPIDSPTLTYTPIAEVKIMQAEPYDKSENDRSGLSLYEGPVLEVIQTESEIAVENISNNPVAIRISWDGKDLYGKGEGGDSFIDNWVEPKEWVSQNFKKQFSVQVWAWGSSTALVDSCSLPITRR